MSNMTREQEDELLDKYARYYHKDPMAFEIEGRGSDLANQFDIQFDFSRKFAYDDDSISINSPVSYYRHICEKESNLILVNEGLIKTYPYIDFVHHIQKFCEKHMTNEELAAISENGNIPAYKKYSIQEVNEKTGEAGLVMFNFPIINAEHISNLVKKLSDEAHLCGYDLSRQLVIDKEYSMLVSQTGEKIDALKLSYEARFFRKSYELTTYLYHVTSLENARKIVKKGLRPQRDKDSRFYYPDRVYLFTGKDLDEIRQHVRKSKYDDVVVLRLKTSTLENWQAFKNGSTEFFIDPKYIKYMTRDKIVPTAIYTHEPIHAMLIDEKCLKCKLVNGKITTAKMTTTDKI